VGTVLFADPFNYANGLITNEYAVYNPTETGLFTNPYWSLTSGSMFEQNGWAWTGVPDGVAPNKDSTTSTNSAIFRAITKRTDFQNIRVTMDLNTKAMISTPATPAVAWDGVHVYLRRQGDNDFYVVTVNRRDGEIIIKKKRSGVYYSMTADGPEAANMYPIPFGVNQKIQVECYTQPDGTVRVNGYVNGVKYVTAVDDGTLGGPEILTGGETGVRGDNTNFTFDNFTVTAFKG
jgi:hypothetical protein